MAIFLNTLNLLIICLIFVSKLIHNQLGGYFELSNPSSKREVYMISHMFLLFVLVLFSSSSFANKGTITFIGQVVTLPELTDKCKSRLEGLYIKNSCMKKNIHLLNSNNGSIEEHYKKVSVVSSYKQSVRHVTIRYSYK